MSIKNLTDKAWTIFQESIRDYHVNDDVNATMVNPYQEGSIDYVLYRKNWIDTVQWHLEDIIRDPAINPVKALEMKRWIDKSNQERTDVVEDLDTWFREQFAQVKPVAEARLNTESPAWAMDRYSILSLKIYHMKEEVDRKDANPEHLAKCAAKLAVLEEQKVDLSTAINELLAEYAEGTKVMKVYRQMKMYNDPSLNPVLYAQKK